MTRDELNSQLLQLVTILRAALTDNREWDEGSDWSRKVNLSPTVFVAISPGDHATSIIVTFADKGVTALAPPDFDDPEQKVPERNPGDQRCDLEKRVSRLTEYLDVFGAWNHDGQLTKSVTLRSGVEVSRVIRSDGGLLYMITKRNEG